MAKKAAKKSGSRARKKTTRKSAARGKAAPKRKSAKKSAKKKATKKKATKKTSRKKAVKAKTAKKKKTRKKTARKTAGKKKPSATKKVTARKKTGRRKAASGKKSTARRLRKDEIRRLKRMLIEHRERLTGQISKLKTEALTRNDSVVSMEDGTDAFDRQFGLSLVSSENNAVFEIDEALRRIEEGIYGQCDECSGAIERARLKALPFAKTCIKCQSEIEKRNPGFAGSGAPGFFQ